MSRAIGHTKKMIFPSMVELAEPQMILAAEEFDQQSNRLLGSDPTAIGRTNDMIELWSAYPPEQRLNRDLAALIMNGVMHRIPRPFGWLIGRVNQIVVDPTTCHRDIQQSPEEAITGTFRVGMKLSTDQNNRMENPNAALGANFMRALLDGYYVTNPHGVVAAAIAFTTAGVLPQLATTLPMYSGVLGEVPVAGYVAGSALGAAVSAYLLSDAIREVPSTLACDPHLPIRRILVGRAAFVGATAMIPPCLEQQREIQR